ncbi:MAG: ABC transporter permease [Bdellovibrionaceae bacterium]|nr:ABC transporter permease [Pseudobdellovibrionaceae bacterium]MBX3034879.1 ABC transporter permease [Pseudobdellovibrionaceae bacterium]
MVAFLTLLERECRRFMKVIVQTVVTPFVSSFLYLLVFGVSLGAAVELKNGVPYLSFLVPGLMMMALINNSFQNSSSSIVSSKFSGDIEDLAVVPLTDNQIIWALGLGALLRGVLVALVTLAVGEVFHDQQLGVWLPVAHPLYLLYFTLVGGLLFAFLGISVAFWSKGFEHLSAFSSFVLLPLTYLGGVFISVESLSPFWQQVSRLNPLLYLINGFRYGMLGVSDVEITQSLLVSFLGLLVFYVMARISLSRGSFQRW